jgi:hypothetical protein
MAARQIPEYTEAQLAREIERLGAKKYFPKTEETNAAWEYYKELVDEDARRAPIRLAQGLPAAASAAPAWDIDIPKGRRLVTERVA